MELVLRNRELSVKIYATEVGTDHMRNVVLSFLDTATTAFGRSTHYNSAEEQQVAESAAHNVLLDFNRDLYLVLLNLPGLTDRSQALGVKNLLATRNKGVITPDQEREILYRLMSSLRPDRMLKAMEGFRVGYPELGIKKANNARTRKLTLRLLFGASQFEWWAVRYKKRIHKILVHAWGTKLTGAIKSILSKRDNLTRKETGILSRNIWKYSGHLSGEKLYGCVAFILGVGSSYEMPLIKAFEEAKKDLSAGKKLPPEVLEGIRSTYHKDIPHSAVLEMTAKSGSMSAGQRVQKTREAQKAGVSTEVMQTDLSTLDSVKLYLYSFEMGETDEIKTLLLLKARKAAKSFPTHYDKLGVVVDISASMAGSSDQKLRPLATVLALRDMLSQASGHTWFTYTGGHFSPRNGKLCEGPTNLARPLVEVLMHEPDAVFVLSDGYENAPAGQFNEAVQALRRMGNDTPIYHLNPVYAAEAGGVRQLSPLVPELPARDPGSLGVTMVRGLLEADPVRGIQTLIDLALKNAPRLLEVSYAAD